MITVADRALFRLIQSALPMGGNILSLTEAYFDESAAGHDQTIFCVGGYLVDSEVAPLMAEEWNALLQKNNINIFHMKDCAHGNGEFENLSGNERSDLVVGLIDIIHRRVTLGVTAGVNIKQYKRQPFANDISPDGFNYYQMALFILLMNCVKIVIDERIEGEILYHFEAGHSLEKSCSSLITKMMELDKENNYHRYAGHAFLPKKSGATLLQAADLLVWLTTKSAKSVVEGRPVRKDANALMSKKHWQQIFYIKENGVAVLGDATPYSAHLASPLASVAAKHLHSGQTPSIALPGIGMVDGVVQQTDEATLLSSFRRGRA